MFRPDILVSIYGWILGSNLLFRNPEKILEGENYVLVPHMLVDSHATG